MSVKEYIKRRFIEAGIYSQPPEDRDRVTVFLSSSHHAKFKAMADVLGCSKTSLISDILAVVAMDDIPSIEIGEAKGLDFDEFTEEGQKEYQKYLQSLSQKEL